MSGFDRNTGLLSLLLLSLVDSYVLLCMRNNCYRHFTDDAYKKYYSKKTNIMLQGGRRPKKQTER